MINQELPPLVEAFRNLRVLVVGDAMLDVYLSGSTERLCREAPVPVVNLSQTEDAPGGAANTAANLRALGAAVRIIGLAGHDAEGERLQAALARCGVETDGLLRIKQRRTLTKTRVIAGPQMLLRLDEGSTAQPEPREQQILASRLYELASQVDLVIVSDYQYGAVSSAVLAALRELQCQRELPLVVDGKDLSQYRNLRPTAIKPNYEELRHLLGPSLPQRRQRVEAVRPLGDAILDRTGARIAAVTLDREGALVFERGQAPYRTYARPMEESRAAGAGDTFVAAFGLALAAGAQTPAAAEIASAASNLVVTKNGTAVCQASELREALTGNDKLISNRDQLRARAALWRRQGKRVVFTNGCFDIIHRGHVSYLNAAKSLGDLLVVGVNSDASVARLKGPQRPINCLEDRMQILAALSCVDALAPFEEDSPTAMIEALRPDVFVKGGDYNRQSLPEAALVESLGGVVEILPYVEDHSTTGIIGRIRQAAVGAP